MEVEYGQDESAQHCPANGRVQKRKGRPGVKATSIICQVPGCGTELRHEKRYYRRYRICCQHAGVVSLRVEGKEQRFCQACGRFHELAEFEGLKKSCMRKLAQHNQRRRMQSSAAKKAGSLPPPCAGLALSDSMGEESWERSASLPATGAICTAAPASPPPEQFAAQITPMGTPLGSEELSSGRQVFANQPAAAPAPPVSLALPLFLEESSPDAGQLQHASSIDSIFQLLSSISPRHFPSLPPREEPLQPAQPSDDWLAELERSWRSPSPETQEELPLPEVLVEEPPLGPLADPDFLLPSPSPAMGRYICGVGVAPHPTPLAPLQLNQTEWLPISPPFAQQPQVAQEAGRPRKYPLPISLPMRHGGWLSNP